MATDSSKGFLSKGLEKWLHKPIDISGLISEKSPLGEEPGTNVTPAAFNTLISELLDKMVAQVGNTSNAPNALRKYALANLRSLKNDFDENPDAIIHEEFERRLYDFLTSFKDEIKPALAEMNKGVYAAMDIQRMAEKIANDRTSETAKLLHKAMKQGRGK